MQTFMPYWNFTEVAYCLDNKRLGKQRVEAKQILSVLSGETTAWQNHPAVRMWRGYESGLKFYFNCMVKEWIGRGFKNTMELYAHETLELPEWILDERVIQSHRTNLVRKDSAHYSQFGWENYNIKGYYWPVEPKTKKAQDINADWRLVIDGQK